MIEFNHLLNDAEVLNCLVCISGDTLYLFGNSSQMDN